MSGSTKSSNCDGVEEEPEKCKRSERGNSKREFRISSIGGGPAFDLVAVLALLQSLGIILDSSSSSGVAAGSSISSSSPVNNITCEVLDLMPSWADAVEERREVDRCAAQEARHREAKEKHDGIVRGVLAKLGSERGEILREVLFGAWRDWVEEGRRATVLGEVAAGAERLRRLHQVHVST